MKKQQMSKLKRVLQSIALPTFMLTAWRMLMILGCWRLQLMLCVKCQRNAQSTQKSSRLHLMLIEANAWHSNPSLAEEYVMQTPAAYVDWHRHASLNWESGQSRDAHQSDGFSCSILQQTDLINSYNFLNWIWRQCQHNRHYCMISQ